MNIEEIKKLIKKNQKNNKYHYVYALCYEDNQPFYIGKGKNYRIFDHETFAKNKNRTPHNPLKNGVIKKIINNNSKINYQIYKFFKNNNSALEFEKSVILKYGIINEGGILTNLQKYACGHTDWNLTSRERISISLKKYYSNPKHVEQCRQRSLETYKKRPELKEIHRKNTKQRFKDPDERKKQSQIIKNSYIKDPTLKRRQIETLKKRNKKDPNRIKKLQMIGIKRYKNKPWLSKQISNQLKEKYKKDPFIQIKKGITRSKSNKEKRKIQNECQVIIKNYNIQIQQPTGYQNKYIWLEFKEYLLTLIINI